MENTDKRFVAKNLLKMINYYNFLAFAIVLSSGIMENFVDNEESWPNEIAGLFHVIGGLISPIDGIGQYCGHCPN